MTVGLMCDGKLRFWAGVNSRLAFKSRRPRTRPTGDSRSTRSARRDDRRQRSLDRGACPGVELDPGYKVTNNENEFACAVSECRTGPPRQAVGLHRSIGAMLTWPRIPGVRGAGRRESDGHSRDSFRGRSSGKGAERREQTALSSAPG